jgi:hypothetical protein
VQREAVENSLWYKEVLAPAAEHSQAFFNTNAQKEEQIGALWGDNWNAVVNPGVSPPFLEFERHSSTHWTIDDAWNRKLGDKGYITLYQLAQCNLTVQEAGVALAHSLKGRQPGTWGEYRTAYRSTSPYLRQPRLRPIPFRTTLVRRRRWVRWRRS